MHTIYSTCTINDSTDQPWTAIITPALASTLTISKAIALAKTLRKLTGWHIRIDSNDHSGWKWGSDLSKRDIVRTRLDYAPYAHHRGRYARRSEIATLADPPMPKAPGAE